MICGVLVLAASFGCTNAVEYVACTNCNAVGTVEISCPTCSGSGKVLYVSSRRAIISGSKFVQPVDTYKGCPKCSKGLQSVGSVGSGKVRSKCPVCFGKKKIIKKINTSS